MKIYKISKIQYNLVNFDVDSDGSENNYEDIDQIEKLFQKNQIRPNRNKELKDIAKNDNNPIGGVYENWDIDHYENIATFSFDIVVDQAFRKQKIGTELIERALKRYGEEKDIYLDMGLKTKIELEVINPFLSDFLIKKYGFKIKLKSKDKIILEKF